MKFLQSFTVSAMLLFAAGCNRGESALKIPAVQPFSVNEYAGVWHEAARMPHWFEKDMENVTAEYYPDENGVLRVRNRGCRDGKETVANGYVRQKKEGIGELEVSFFRPFYGAYRIIALKKDYSAALVTSSTKDYAWILVRDPEYAEHVIPEYVALLKNWGFDCSKLIYPAMKK